ncbi:TPA: hypothetical protein ACQUH4_001580 [Neisseria cinerea]
MPQEFIGDDQSLKVWVPACARRTEFQIIVFDFLFCGNNGILDDVHLSGKLKTSAVIPAQAGI